MSLQPQKPSKFPPCLNTPLALQTLGLPQLGSKLPVQQPPAAEENQKVLTVAQL